MKKANAKNRTGLPKFSCYQRVPGWCEGTARRGSHPLRAVGANAVRQVARTGIPPLSGNLLIRQDLRVPSGDEPKRRGGNRKVLRSQTKRTTGMSDRDDR
ncbi:hypothetical protein H6B11_14505 [Mediterraneibacter glycyrrhizinilyticus]|nr:hypothetical protein [Mediterraneibacter glycyrrhizinilyticus]MBM6855347.1 hypothetical protein [Mediterraneibacter glycyrrhizinilyticus]